MPPMASARTVAEENRASPEKDRQYVTALARGLRILRCFGHERRELSPQEIVRLTGLPQATVWRLCYTLHREGFIHCSGENGKMTLGLPALALTTNRPARSRCRQFRSVRRTAPDTA